MEKAARKEPLEFKINKARVMAVKAVQRDHLERMVQKARVAEIAQKDLLETRVNKVLMAEIAAASKKAHTEDQEKTNDNVFGQFIFVLREGCKWMVAPSYNNLYNMKRC